MRETSLAQKPAQEWLQEIQSLFNFHLLQKYSDSNQPPVLHGRLVLIGLSLLAPQVRIQLEEDGVFPAIINELEEPLDEILSPRGVSLFRQKSEDELGGASEENNTSSKGEEPFDSVPNQPDEPLEKMAEDQLGRAAFARYLARRIQAVPVGSGTYSFHIYGPWGSGKSTLLNFLKEDLQATGEWMVTEFNAWRHQHIRPPWWSLMESVFRQTKSELSFREKLAEYWWRLTTGRIEYIIAFVVILWLFAYFGLQNAPVAENVSKVIALIVTLWGLAIGVSRSLLFGSAEAATTYMKLTHDPMETIKVRFQKLMQRILPKRIAVFIDDLDRCQSGYVIELLEGIQTLFRDAPVIFVVAADRQWLNACYGEAYQDFKQMVREPGKPLGTLFLEKAFQFSTPVPGIPQELKEAFWRDLVQVQVQGQKSTIEEARKKARDLMANTGSEGAVLRVVDDSRNKSFFEQRAIREEAVVRLAAPEVVERTEHALIPFAGLLDPNPRSMKRLVNSYSVNRAMATLSHVDIERDDLALWTILSLRWPALAEFLEKNPERIEKILEQNSATKQGILAELCGNGEVRRVLQGGPTNRALSETVVRQCAKLWV